MSFLKKDKEKPGNMDAEKGASEAQQERMRPDEVQSDPLSSVKIQIHVKLNQVVDPCKVSEQDKAAAAKQVTEAVTKVVETDFASLSGAEKEKVIKDVTEEFFDMGPISPLIEDPTVNDILVNHFEQTYVERRGKLYPTEVKFKNDEHVQLIIQRIVTRIGREIDRKVPLVDARLPDGSRVNAIIPPLTLRGSSISIRKFNPIPFSADDYVRMGACTPEMVKFLEVIVKGRLNVLISGGTGSGKTTLLNMVSKFIPNNERIVTIEDAAELRPQQDHVVSMETRPATKDGLVEINQRDLVRNALRMRPDRIIVGEVRGAEVLDMLQAMNTGHDGSLTTIHANAPRDAMGRMEMMMLYGGITLPHIAMLKTIVSAINVIVQLTRFNDGIRRISYITEITGMEGEVVTMSDIAKFEQEGYDSDGRVKGRFVVSRVPPKFMDLLRARGVT